MERFLTVIERAARVISTIKGLIMIFEKLGRFVRVLLESI